MKRRYARRIGDQLRGLGKTMEDSQVAMAPLFCEEWTMDTDYSAGDASTPADRRRVGDTVYKCQISHHAPNDPNYSPDKYAAGWKPIPRPDEDGSIKHPNTFSQGMELIKDQYYRQSGVLYRCILGVAWLYDDLKNVVGNYVEVVA